MDFVRGASASKGGVSIMAMPSTVKGKISKIVPLLDEGAAVTTSRNDVDYIVTEWRGRAEGPDSPPARPQPHRNCPPRLPRRAKAEYEKRFHCKWCMGRRPAPFGTLRRGIERKRAMTNLEKYDRLFLTAFRVKLEELPGLKYRGTRGTPLATWIRWGHGGDLQNQHRHRRRAGFLLL